MASSRGFLSGVTVGASLAYFLDAERGPDRRDRFQRRVAPLIAEARRSLGMESVEKDVALEMLRFGARVGDIQGLGAATLESPGGFGHTETVLRVAGALLALYGLVRRGSVGALIRTLGAGMLVGSARDSLSGITRLESNAGVGTGRGRRHVGSRRWSASCLVGARVSARRS